MVAASEPISKNDFLGYRWHWLSVSNLSSKTLKSKDVNFLTIYLFALR